MSSIYCHGKFAEMEEKDGWWWCGGCGKRLWLIGTTFEVGRSRVPSGHASEKDSPQENTEAKAQPAGAEEAGGV